MEPGETQGATDFLFGSVDKGHSVPPPRVRGVRLDAMIGEGAFGVVWKGEQFEPVVRPVAVKILRVGALGSSALRRFEAEKIALARLEHPHIAHILDAGNTADGAPYLVMEYVEGVPFDAWCHKHRDSLEARVRMLVFVCRAIGYAHRQGILHRDLKPANVLVRGVGVGADLSATDEPRIIDFGVAKLVGNDALRTETRQGPTAATPAYMSPEIASGSSEIDGRVDVWSLGVMLFEALVATRPFTSDREGMAGALELQRQILEERAPRPSAMLAPNAPRAVRAALEDDLDWIALRALERSPARRYTTPDELADDLERWLTGAPVSARPLTTVYRLRKLARRHKAPLVVACIALGSLTLAVGGLAYGLIESQRQAGRWREIARLNRSMLTALDPAVAQGLDPRLLKLVLVEAELELERSERDPTVEAEVRSALGLAHAATGNFAEALRQFRTERGLRLTAGSPVDGPAIREIDNAIGHALVESGALDEARAPLEHAANGVDLIAANAVHNLAALANANGDIERADELLRESLSRKALLPETPVMSRLETEQELALILAQRGRYADAEPIARALYKSKLGLLGARHPSTLRAANNLAAATLELGDVASALTLYEENRSAFQSRGGPADSRTLLASANLAQCLALNQRHAEAEREFKSVSDSALRTLGPSHRITLANDGNYAAFLTEQERFAEAVVVLERAVPLIEQALGFPHPQCLAARTTLARARLGLNQPARALEVLPEAGSLAARPQTLTRLERRALEIAAQAAKATGDNARAELYESALAQKS